MTKCSLSYTGLENQVLVLLRVAVLHRFYCIFLVNGLFHPVWIQWYCIKTGLNRFDDLLYILSARVSHFAKKIPQKNILTLCMLVNNFGYFQSSADSFFKLTVLSKIIFGNIAREN